MNKARRKLANELILNTGITPQLAYETTKLFRDDWQHACWKNGALVKFQKEIPGGK